MPKKKTTTKTKKTPPVAKRKEKFQLQSLKGMHDILPRNGKWWTFFMKKGYEISHTHNFSFIETPILEFASIFEKGVGSDTDIVEKEMYSFTTKGRDRVALRPEGTSPLMRSYLQHHLGRYALPLKVFHHGPMFRYERPQAGRYRQFHQWDFDIIGDGDPFYDVQTILAFVNFLKVLGIKNPALKINTIGCRVCRISYRKKLLSYYKDHKKELCEDCLKRYDKNPFRLLDCKAESCKKIKNETPITLNHLCQSCNSHFKGVLEFVEDVGLEYTPDPHLVRGLDYYNKTVFEIYSKENENLALVGGGRYDYLSEIIGNRPVPAVGGAMGIERIIGYLKETKIDPKLKDKPIVFFIAIGNQAKKKSLCYINRIRESGIRTGEAIGKKSIGAQLKAADKAKATLALILGQKECFEETIIIRDMNSGAQEIIPIEKIVGEAKKRLRSSPNSSH